MIKAVAAVGLPCGWVPFLGLWKREDFLGSSGLKLSLEGCFSQRGQRSGVELSVHQRLLCVPWGGPGTREPGSAGGVEGQI